MSTGIFTTSSGARCYRYENQIFHSQYTPEKEVGRFIDALGTLPTEGIFLLLGETLGYISQELRRRFPRSTVVAIVPEESLLNQDIPDVQIRFPNTDRDFQSLLKSVVTEENFSRCRLLVWPAYRRTFPVRTKNWETFFLDHFRMIQGSLITQAHFGPRWCINTLRNLQTFRHHPLPSGLHNPVVITASGPSLERSRLILQKYRRHFYLLSLPSSLRALESWGLRCDGVMVTDGGYWSKLHLRHLSPTSRILQCPSAVHEPGITNPRSFFSQDLMIENRIMAGSPDYLKIPSQGTVAVSALTWAQHATSGPVVILGLDLAVLDGRSHVRPHTFDDWNILSATRIRPLQTWEDGQTLDSGLRFLGPGAKTSPSLDTYGAYFQNYHPEKPVFRLFEGYRPFPGFKSMEPEQFTAMLETYPPQDFATKSGETHDFSHSTRDWIRSMVEGLKSGSQTPSDLKEFLHQTWPLGNPPATHEILPLLERNILNVPAL